MLLREIPKSLNKVSFSSKMLLHLLIACVQHCCFFRCYEINLCVPFKDNVIPAAVTFNLIIMYTNYADRYPFCVYPHH